MSNNKRKKRIYSKNKTPIFKSETPIANNFDLLCKIKQNVPSSWQRYIKYVVYNNDICGELEGIIAEIWDNHKKKSVLKELMSIEEFNPFFPNLSLIENDTTRNLLLKKKRYYDEYKNYCRLIHFKCGEGIIFHTSHNDKNDNYNIKIIFNSYSKRIIFKNGKKHCFDLDNILKSFNELDNNVWNIYNSKSFIYVNKGCKSNLDLHTLVSIIKENEL